MKANVEITKTTTLVLDEFETSWLKALIQNPIGVSPEEEDAQNKEMRTKFWNALSGDIVPNAIMEIVGE